MFYSSPHGYASDQPCVYFQMSARILWWEPSGLDVRSHYTYQTSSLTPTSLPSPTTLSPYTICSKHNDPLKNPWPWQMSSCLHIHYDLMPSVSVVEAPPISRWPAAVVFLRDGTVWEALVLCGLGMEVKEELCMPQGWGLGPLSSKGWDPFPRWKLKFSPVLLAWRWRELPPWNWDDHSGRAELRFGFGETHLRSLRAHSWFRLHRMAGTGIG